MLLKDFLCSLTFLEGEFVRAEGAMNIGDKPRLVSKGDVIGKHNRILRVMTTKRKVWQSS